MEVISRTVEDTELIRGTLENPGTVESSEMASGTVEGTELENVPIMDSDSDDDLVNILFKRKNCVSRLRLMGDSDEENVKEDEFHKSLTKNAGDEEDKEEFEKDEETENVDTALVPGKQRRSRILNWNGSSDEDEEPPTSELNLRKFYGAGLTNDRLKSGGNFLKDKGDVNPADRPSSLPRNHERTFFADTDLFDAEGSSSDEGSGTNRKTFNQDPPVLESDDEGVSLADLKQAATNAAKVAKTPLPTRARRPKKTQLKDLHSESQRLVRESRVKLPYHVPQQRTLDEFLNRRKSTPNILKPGIREVENILKKVAMFNQKSKETSADNLVVSPAKRKLTMDLPGIEQQPNQLMAVGDSMPCEVLPSLDLCRTEAGYSKIEKPLTADVREEDLSRNWQVLEGAGPCSATSAEYEMLPELLSIHGVDGLTSKDAKELILELPKEQAIDRQQAADGRFSDSAPSSDAFKDPSVTDSDPAEDQTIPKTDLRGQISTVNPKIKLPLQIMDAAKNFIPKLNGRPNTVICLEDSEQQLCVPRSGVHCLIERFIQHTTPKQPPKVPHNINLSILKKVTDSSGEQKLTTENITVNADATPRIIGNATPGAALSLLKETLKAELARKRAEARQKRLILQAEENEEGFSEGNVSEEEEELLSDMTDSDEEADEDCDAEDEDEDAEDDNGPEWGPEKHKSAFLDDEAIEEDNGDLEEEEERDEDEQYGAKKLSIHETSHAEISKSKKDDSSEEALKLHLDSDDSEVDATQLLASDNDGSNASPMSRCNTLELFPSPPFENRMTENQKLPSISKNQSLDTSFELLGSIIPAYQPGGGMLHQRETLNCSGFSMKRKFSTLSLPIEDSQELFQQTPAKDNVSTLEDFVLSPLEGFDTQTDIRSTGTSSIRRRLGFVETTEISTQDNMNELLDLCSGDWTKPFVKKQTAIERLCEAQSLTSNQENVDQLMDLCSGSFHTLLPSTESGKVLQDDMTTSVASVEQHSTGLGAPRPDLPRDEDYLGLKIQNALRSEDELSISSLISDELPQRRRRHVKRLVSDSDSDQEDASSVRCAIENSANDGTHVKGFFEDEAELSGSDAPSDEDEDLAEEDDILEEELGDLDEYSEDEVKNQVEKVHMKMMLDEDQRRLRLYKEMYLEDGDLHTDGQGRVRKFRWRNIDEASNDDAALVKLSDSEGEEGHEMENVELRLQRHEREKWLHDHKMTEINDDSLLVEQDSSHFTCLKKKVHVLSRNNSLVMKSETAEGKLDLQNSLNDPKKSVVNFCGSFLARSKDVLSKIAQMTKGSGDGASNGPRNSRNFVFATVSPTKEESAEPPAKMRRVSSVPFPTVTTAKPNLNKRLSLPDSCSQEDADCMNRWKNLRERYGRELRRKKKPSGTGGGVHRKWVHMKSMSFLDKFIKPRRMTIGNVERCESPSSTDGDKRSTTAQVDSVPGNSTDITEMSLDDNPELNNKDESSPALIDLREVHSVRKRRDHSNMFLAKVQAARGSVERLTNFIAGEAKPEEPPRPKERIQALCDLMSFRYNALSESLQDDFDIAALQLLQEYTRKNKQIN